MRSKQGYSGEEMFNIIAMKFNIINRYKWLWQSVILRYILMEKIPLEMQ